MHRAAGSLGRRNAAAAARAMRRDAPFSVTSDCSVACGMRFVAPLPPGMDFLVLREEPTRGDLVRFCRDQSVSPHTGVPVAAFARYVERIRQSGPSTSDQIRAFPSFRIVDGRILLPDETAAAEASSTAATAHEAALRHVALSMPGEGLTADEMKQRLAEDVPDFTPKSVGAVTMREAIGKYPHLFEVVRGDGAAAWSVVSVIRSTSGADDGGASGAMSSLSPAEALDAALLSAHAAEAANRGSAGEKVWMDVEPLLRGVPKDVRDRITDWNDAIGNLASFDVKATTLTRPVRRVRSAHIFVDGDGLTAQLLELVMNRFRIDATSTTAFVARSTSTPALTADDTITPMDIPGYMAIEAAADKLLRAHHIVLKDVCYIVSDEKFDMYTEHVSRSVTFPDAEVWVLTPKREVLVSSWKAAVVAEAKSISNSE